MYRKEGAKQGGELDLGGVDNTHYTGELYYEEVIEQEYWKIEMDSWVNDCQYDVISIEIIMDHVTTCCAVYYYYYNRILSFL